MMDEFFKIQNLEDGKYLRNFFIWWASQLAQPAKLYIDKIQK